MRKIAFPDTVGAVAAVFAEGADECARFRVKLKVRVPVIISSIYMSDSSITVQYRIQRTVCSMSRKRQHDIVVIGYDRSSLAFLIFGDTDDRRSRG